MSDLKGQPGELRIVLEITRKDTGEIETVELVGHADPEKLKELTNGSHTLDSSTQRGD